MISIQYGNTDVIKKATNWEFRIDRWVAIIGGFIPISIVLGVVAFQFIISLAGLVWLISRVKYPLRWHDGLRQNKLLWALFGWYAAVLVSRVFNGGNAFQFAHDFVFLRYPLFVVAILDVSRRIPVHRYLIGGLLAGIAYAGINLLSAHLIGYDLIGKPLFRYVHKMNEGGRIGGLCAYAAPFLLLWGITDGHQDNRKRFGIIAMGCLGLFLLVSSQVRTALISALIGLCGGLLCKLLLEKRIKIGSILALFLVAGLGVCGALWMQPSMLSMYDRLFFWKVSWKLWLQNPIIGVGISSFNEAYRQIAESGTVAPVVTPTGVIFHSVNPRHAHNLFLQLMTCNGLLGLGVFLWVFLQAVEIIRHRITSWHVGLLSWPFICIGIGLTGWNIYDPYYTTLVFYFLAIITISANGEMDRHIDQRPLPG